MLRLILVSWKLSKYLHYLYEIQEKYFFGLLAVFYGIPTFVDYLMSNNIYCYPDSFVESQLFSVARQVRCLKLESKPCKLLPHPEFLPHSQEETQPKQRDFNAYVSLLFCLHIYS